MSLQGREDETLPSPAISSAELRRTKTMSITKIAICAQKLLPGALMGDPAAIAALAALGITAGYMALKAK